MICRNCGFHNAPADEYCGSCGEYLWNEGGGDATVSAAPVLGAAAGLGAADEAPQAAAAAPVEANGNGPEADTGSAAPAPTDPHAATRIVPTPLQRCWNCGTANEATRTFCQSCGQQLRLAKTRRWRQVRGASVAPSSEVEAPAGGREGWMATERSRRYLLVGGGVAVLALLLLVGAVVGGFLGGRDDALADPDDATTAGAANVPASTPREGAAATDGPPTDPGATNGSTQPAGATATPLVDGRFRCETQTVTAAAGDWQVHRARYGSRSGYDYFSLQLRRRGSGGDGASATAEVVAIADVEARYGVEPPDGDVAIVIVFDGPVGLSGSFGRSTNQRALREFRLLRRDGRTYAVVGVAGSGCFELLAPGWSDGSTGTASVTLDIQR